MRFAGALSSVGGAITKAAGKAAEVVAPAAEAAGRATVHHGTEFGKGAGAEVSDTLGGARDAVRWLAGRDPSMPPPSEVFGYARENPGDALRAVGSELTSGMTSDVKGGEYSHAAGRAAVGAASILIPGDGIFKVARALAAQAEQAGNASRATDAAGTAIKAAD